eukprot:381977_1
MSNNKCKSKSKSKSISIPITTPINNKEWIQITEWLHSLNYSNYIKLFKDGGYDLWEIIYDLSIDDLKSLGILPGHSKRIYHKLQLKKELKNNISSTSDKHSHVNAQRININNNVPPNVICVPTAQQLQQLAIEERRRKLRERFQANALFAGGIKNKLFETMTRVLNGLQQELIQYNGKFAEPINEMNQRIVALQKLDVHNLDGIWDSNDGLFEPMMRNIKDIKKYNNDMWSKINEFHNLAELQIKNSIKQLQNQINLINQMKTHYLINKQQQQHIKYNHSLNKLRGHIPLNKIVTNNNHQSAKVSHVNISNIPNHYKFIQQSLPKINHINVINTTTTTHTNSNMKSNNTNNNNGRNKKKEKSTNGTRKPAYTQGEVEMMKNYDKKKQSVADIIDLQRKMQAIYGIPRSAYGIAQKMYRMGVLSATLPKKLQALQDKPDADKIKIGDGIMNIRKTKIKNDSVSVSDSYYSSNDDGGESTTDEDDDDDDDITSNSSNDNNDNIIKKNILLSPIKLGTHTNSKPKTVLSHLFNYDYMGSDSSNTIPQRKAPSTNLRRYTADEVNYIRKLIDDYPKEEAKVLFNKFRKTFPSWKDETEAYTKFYQKKWRLAKEKQNNLNHKRKRQSSNTLIYSHTPPNKKIKIINEKIVSPIPILIQAIPMTVNIPNVGNVIIKSQSQSQSPKTPKKEISFDENIMQNLPTINTNVNNGKKDILPPPLPPPPADKNTNNK